MWCGWSHEGQERGGEASRAPVGRLWGNNLEVGQTGSQLWLEKVPAAACTRESEGVGGAEGAWREGCGKRLEAVSPSPELAWVWV